MFFKIVIYTIKRQLRDREAMLMLLLFPIVLILILGSALSGAFRPGSIGKISVAYLNEDAGEAGRRLDGFLNSEEISTYLEVKPAKSAEQGREMVSEGEAKAFIYIDPDYTKQFIEGKNAEIDVFLQTASQVDLSVIEGILNSFGNGANTVNAMIKTGLVPGEFVQLEAAKQSPVSKNGKIPGSIDYYAVTMLVMTLMYGTLYGGIGINEMFHENLGNRLLTTPANKLTLFSGVITGFMATMFAQGMIIFLFTKYVYGVYWGENLAAVLLIILAMSFMTVSLGTFVGMVARERRVTVAVLQMMVPLATFISSGYFKFRMPDPVIKNIIHSVIPNALAQTALFNTIYGGPAEETARSIVIILTAGALFILGSVIAGRRKTA